MHCRISATSRPTLHLGAATAAATIAVVLMTSGVFAQTLSDPNPPPKRSPKSAAKSPAARVKSCSAYGAGFVNVPGTDACVKIGGWVSVEGGTR